MSSLSRRNFIKATAATAAIGSMTAMAEPIAAEDTSASNIYISVKGGRIGGNKEEMVARLKELKALGFDGVEGASPGIPNTRALREAMEEADFPVHGVVDMVHWKDRLSSPDQAIRDKGRMALEQAIRDTHAFGGSAVLLVPGKVTGDNETHDHVWERSIIEIRKVLPVASRLGVFVLIENVWNGFCETPEQMRDYIDEINSPWVGAYFDIGNCRKFGPAEDWVRTLGKRIVKLDIKDWGKANGFCRLGEGDVNWPEVKKALSEIGFSGWATREGRDKSLEDTVELCNTLLR